MTGSVFFRLNDFLALCVVTCLNCVHCSLVSSAAGDGAAKKKAAPKRKKKESVFGDDSDSDEGVKPKKRAAPKKPAKKPAFEDLSDDSEDEFAEKPKKSVARVRLAK